MSQYLLDLILSLKPFIGKIRHLHLDTKYCDPKYIFPKQCEILEFIKNVVCELYQRHTKRILFVIGTNFIGKEKILLTVFNSLNKKSKIYVTRYKQIIYKLLNLNLNNKEIFTTNPNESQIFEVSINEINNKSLKNLLNINKDRFDYIVGFISNELISKPTKRKNGNNVIIVKIPYAIHSSFSELKWFVRKLEPKKIIPTSNIQQARKFVPKLQQF